ncbi:MAG: pyridoxal phosphate-dependent aminotransferase [Muribaculaceae bacterium]|nr:pyridoxal phosphate-dependent aminotransferase [Muribaculaceae bacterium]
MDFDKLTPRYGSGSYKWDSASEADIIPLWVADMDFTVAHPITDALMKRVKHGIFGYTYVSERYYDAVMRWYGERYGILISRDDILYTSGVVPAISATIKALTHPGDGVIIMTPVYNCFFSSIRNNGCRQVDVPLIREDFTDRTFTYKIDFPRLRAALEDPRNRVLLLCNPHNPAGRAWTAEELGEIAELCRQTGTTLLSDEIHGDLTMPGYRFTPILSAIPADTPSVTFSSPSKAFNTAGLQIANIITRNPSLRYAIDRALNDNEVCDVNPFGVEALIAAYNDSRPWLEGVIGYIHNNAVRTSAQLLESLPFVSIARLEASYLLWVDISRLHVNSTELEETLREQYRVWINAGDMYGSDGYIRINLATSAEILDKGLDRLIEGLTHVYNRNTLPT